MKLSKGTMCGVILLLVLAIGAYGLFARPGQSGFNGKSGFQSLKWGAPISEHKDAKPLDFRRENTRSEYFCTYHKRAGEELSIGKVPFRGISYSFLIVDGVEKFESASISPRLNDDLRNPDQYVPQILDILTKEYGKYEKKGTGRDECYIFEDDYTTVHYWVGRGAFGEGYIKISSKEMRSRYPEIYDKTSK